MRSLAAGAFALAFRPGAMCYVQGFRPKAHWLVVMAGVQLPAPAPIAAEEIMQAVHHSQAVLALSGPPSCPPRRRRVYFARWALGIGASLAGGTVVARTATALGRQIYVILCPCGATRHLIPQN